MLRILYCDHCDTGDITIHDSSVQHFVTPLVQGLRYGFFFVTMPRTRMAARVR